MLEWLRGKGSSLCLGRDVVGMLKSGGFRFTSGGGSLDSLIFAGIVSRISLICCWSWSSALDVLILLGLPGLSAIPLRSSSSTLENSTGVRGGDSSLVNSTTVGTSWKLTESDLVLDRKSCGEPGRLASSLGIASATAPRCRRGKSGVPWSRAESLEKPGNSAQEPCTTVEAFEASLPRLDLGSTGSSGSGTSDRSCPPRNRSSSSGSAADKPVPSLLTTTGLSSVPVKTTLAGPAISTTSGFSR
ncbi:hypothetical protein VTK73DRAFT_8450 [Phialemonium thermophilum]|uniref:Uncharacterized protein n=1 Tax=Phialemonium thermophilum TaxID=223376 RepID=A0ABR3W8P5_9PEZI